jgi:hypothetical protein
VSIQLPTGPFITLSIELSSNNCRDSIMPLVSFVTHLIEDN